MSHRLLVATNRTSRAHIRDYSASAKKQHCDPPTDDKTSPRRRYFSPYLVLTVVSNLFCSSVYVAYVDSEDWGGSVKR